MGVLDSSGFELDRIGSALMAGATVPIAAFWYWLGVPPTTEHSFFGVSFFYAEFLTVIASIIGCAKLRQLAHRGGVISLIGFSGMVGLTSLFFAVPVAWTIIDARHAMALLHPTDFAPLPCASSPDSVLIAHISDLHITDKNETRDGKHPGNSRLTTLVRQISARNPSYLLVSGDLTDTGDAAHWAILRSILKDAAPTLKVVITPGNHDLNQFFGKDPSYYDLKSSDAELTQRFEVLPRIARVLFFQSSFLPAMRGSDNRTLAELADRVPTKATLDQYHEEILKCAKDCAELFQGSEDAIKADIGCYFRCSKDWRAMRFRYFNTFENSFPWLYLDLQRDVAFVSLASTLGKTSTAGQNAIGYVDDDQIDRLKNTLQGLPKSINLIVITLHHPLFRENPPSIPSMAWRELAHPLSLWDRIYSSEWFMSIFLQNNAVQAQKLYAVLSAELQRRGAASAIIMFGHRHERSLSRIGDIILEEAPNVATENAKDFGFYSVSRESDSSVAVRWCASTQ
ncbi:MAG: metallophosphoesterase [Bryobacteraceae bacterium]